MSKKKKVLLILVVTIVIVGALIFVLSLLKKQNKEKKNGENLEIFETTLNTPNFVISNISWFNILECHTLSTTFKGLGISWQIKSKMLIYFMYKTRTVNTICQTVTSPYIRVSNPLHSVSY